MTREEAKEIFLNRGYIGGIYDGDKWREACIVISEWLEQEPRKGHWIEGINKYNVKIVYCSECKNKAPYAVLCGADHYGRDISLKFKKTNYCPTCGIKMDNGESEEKEEKDD